jgi:phosphinothricin acetyltransferase
LDPAPPRVRPATIDDLAQITDLYNHYVLTSPATFDVTPFTVDERREWFGHYADAGRYRLLVADDAGSVLGYCTSSPYRPRAAYDTTVETSVYVRHDAQGRGVGTALYRELFAAIAAQDLHRAFAGITVPNPGSVALHERFGFRSIGRMHEVGRKFGRYWDVEWFERELG